MRRHRLRIALAAFLLVGVLPGAVLAQAVEPAPLEAYGRLPEDHWLSRAETRQRMLSATVAFLEANNPTH